MIGDKSDISIAFSQGGELNIDSAQAKEQVLTKFSFFDQPLKVSVGGRNKPKIACNFLFPTDSAKFLSPAIPAKMLFALRGATHQFHQEKVSRHGLT